jgi:hypothetical protein
VSLNAPLVIVNGSFLGFFLHASNFLDGALVLVVLLIRIRLKGWETGQIDGSGKKEFE